MDLDVWQKWHPLVRALYDGEHYTGRALPGADLNEWMGLMQTDMDSVDRLYIDAEGIGGE